MNVEDLNDLETIRLAAKMMKRQKIGVTRKAEAREEILEAVDRLMNRLEERDKRALKSFSLTASVEDLCYGLLSVPEWRDDKVVRIQMISQKGTVSNWDSSRNPAVKELLIKHKRDMRDVHA